VRVVIGAEKLDSHESFVIVSVASSVTEFSNIQLKANGIFTRIAEIIFSPLTFLCDSRRAKPCSVDLPNLLN